MIRESNGMWIQENKKYVPNAEDLKQANIGRSSLFNFCNIPKVIRFIIPFDIFIGQQIEAERDKPLD